LLRCYILVRSAREGKTLVVKRQPKFKVDSGGLTQIVEIVTLQWVREVGMRLDEIEETDYKEPPTSPPPIDETDSRHDLHPYAQVHHELPGKDSRSELAPTECLIRNRNHQELK